MKLQDLREKRARAVEQMRAIADDPQGQNGDLTDDQAKRFDELRSESEGLEKQIERAEHLQEAERRTAGTPVGDNAQRDHDQLASQVSVVRAIRSQIRGQLDGAEREYSQEAERRSGRRAQGVFVPMAAVEQRTTTTGNAGQIVAEQHRPGDYIGALRNRLVARQLGVRVLSDLQGDVSIPKYGSGTAVGWVAEDSAVPSADMSFGSVTLSPKHAGGMSEMSRQLIQQSSPDVEQLVRDDLSFMLAQAIDAALIQGGGTNEPVGVLAATGTQSGSLATPNWAEVLELIRLAETANVQPNSFLLAPGSKAALAGTEKASNTAEYLFQDGRMAGVDGIVSNQVPEKSGTPNTGQVILGDWSQVLLGIWSEVDILVNPYESDAYSRGAVKVRAMSTVDTAIRHPEAFIVASDVPL